MKTFFQKQTNHQMQKFLKMTLNSLIIVQAVLKILNVVRPLPNKVLNSQGLKLLTSLRLGLSHLQDYKFKHSFLDNFIYVK